MKTDKDNRSRRSGCDGTACGDATAVRCDCIARCMKTRYIDEERPYLALRMFEHADANRDGKVSVADLGPIKKYLGKGFGASYRAGYELVDYDQNGIVDLWESFNSRTPPSVTAQYKGRI